MGGCILQSVMEVENNTVLGAVALMKIVRSVVGKPMSVKIVRREVMSVVRMTMPAVIVMAAAITVIPIGAVTTAVVVSVL